MAEKLKLISMFPGDFIKGGLVNDIDVEITGAVFCTWDYGGKSLDKALALRLSMKDMASGEEYEQYWSAGDPANFTIVDENGEGGQSEGVALASTTKAGMNDNTNTAHLMVSLLNCGYPKDRLEQFTCADVIGLQGHVLRVPAPKRPGLKQEPQQEGREQTILTFTKIIKLPWEKKSGAAVKKTTAAAAKKTAPAAGPSTDAPDGELDAIGIQVLTEMLEAEGTLPLKGLKVSFLRYIAKAKVATAPQRNPLAQLVSTEEWLLSNGFMVEEGEVTLA